MVLGLLVFHVCMCVHAHNHNTIAFVTAADYPPFEYYSNGEIVGFEVDVVKAIAQKMGYALTVHAVDIPIAFQSVLLGMKDAAFGGLEKTQEREQYFDFSEAYYHNRVALVFAKKKPLTFSTFNDYRIAVQIGTSLMKWVQERVPEAKVHIMQDMRFAVTALHAGAVDGVVMDVIQAEIFVF